MADWDPFADPADAEPESAPVTAVVPEKDVEGNGDPLPTELFGGVPSVRLNNGVLMPIIGSGTMGMTKAAVLTALEKGYRHLDCARMYQNEKEVGEAIQEAQERGIVKREELFITTKLLGTMHGSGKVAGAINQSIRALNCGYVDLFLIHSPLPGPPYRPPFPDYEDTWAGMEKLVDDGKVRAIGVSNFSKLKLERILKVARIKPAVNQVELHPYLPQQDLVQFCKDQTIVMTAHSPLGSADSSLVQGHKGDIVLRIPCVLRAAKKLGKTPAQITLRWLLQRGIAAIPKSNNPERQVENLAVFDWHLAPEEFQALNKEKHRERLWTFARDIFHENTPFPDIYSVWDDLEGLPDPDENPF